MDLVERIRSLAREKGMSLTVLEQKLGLGNGTIGRWTKVSPNTDKLNRIAEYFDVSLDYLLGKTENPTSHKRLANPEYLQRLQEIDSVQFHLLKGIQGLDLSERDVDFLVDMAKKYKLTIENRDKKD